jgi:hypothetical protein
MFFRQRILLLASVHRLSQYSKYHRPDQNQLNSNQFSIQIIDMPTSASLRHFSAGAPVRYGQFDTANMPVTPSADVSATLGRAKLPPIARP